jgi:N-acylneuraminate cytidylyltransferase
VIVVKMVSSTAGCIAGISLVARAVNAGLNAERIGEVFISTDDPEIAKEAKRAGAQVPFMRPDELAEDDTPEWAAWEHAVEELGSGNVDPFVCIPPTAPLRRPKDIDACVRRFQESEADVVLTVREAWKNPYFSMVKPTGDGAVSLVNDPGDSLYRRQDTPEVMMSQRLLMCSTPSSYSERPISTMAGSRRSRFPTRGVSMSTPRSISN